MMHSPIDTLIEQARACRESDHAAGLALAKQAVQAAMEVADTPRQARALAVQGGLLLKLRKAPEAQDCLRRGLALSRAGGDRAVEADCLYRLGEASCLAEQYTEALDYFCQTELLYDALENRAGQAEALNDIGSLYSIFGDYTQAVHFHLQAFRLRDALGDAHGVACSLNNIGNAYGRAEDFEHSVQYHQQCLTASRQNGQTHLESMCLGNLSVGFSSLGRLPEALEAGKAALTLAQEQGSLDKQCYALLSVGRAYNTGQEYAAAVSLFTEAVAAACDSGSRRNECEAQNALGDALLSAGRIADAHAAFTQAEETASALNLTQFRALALIGLSQACEHQGNIAAALAHHKEFHALEKMLFQEAADKRRKMLMMQMEMEEAHKEAQFHQQKNFELAALNAALEEANQALSTQAEEMQAQAELLKAQREELRAQADDLQRQATEDGLTGLANRRSLESRLTLQFNESRRLGSPLTVAMADVDHFKQINDRFGHQIGDEVLVSIGLLLRRSCRISDLAARYGGEEFVLALPETDARQAHAVCERVRRRVEDYPWQSIHPQLSVTISIGLSDDHAALSPDCLLGLADAQLYEAKHAGRNRVAALSQSFGRYVAKNASVSAQA